MIRTTMFLGKTNFDWLKNATELYDMSTDTLVNVILAYTCPNVLSGINLDDGTYLARYTKYLAETNKPEVCVLFTETRYNVVQKLALKRRVLIDWVLEESINKVRSHFTDFEKWIESDEFKASVYADDIYGGTAK